MLLVLQVQHVQLFFRLLHLVLEPGDLLLPRGLALFQLDLEQGQLFHRLFNSLLVLVEHAVGGPVFGLQGLVDVLEFDNLVMEVVELGLKLVPLLLDQLEFFF